MLKDFGGKVVLVTGAVQVLAVQRPCSSQRTLLYEAGYVMGQMLVVDGGMTISKF